MPSPQLWRPRQNVETAALGVPARQHLASFLAYFAEVLSALHVKSFCRIQPSFQVAKKGE